MVTPEFSEFQFTYGLTKEIENFWPKRVVGLPYFPTQNREAEIGSDVVIGIGNGNVLLEPLFLQYKRSERLLRSNATEWDEFRSPYYRFDIHSQNQHNTLVRLGSSLGTAVYVAPGFHTSTEYKNYHESKTLAANSICFDCEDMSNVNNDDHRIVYTLSPLRAAFRSESENIAATEGIRTLLTNMGGFENEFSTYDHLQRQFADMRIEISPDSDVNDEYIERDDTSNPIAWMRAQQQFFFESFGTVLLFVLQSDKVVDQYRHWLVYPTSNLKD
jgi:hypothetical protein